MYAIKKEWNIIYTVEDKPTRKQIEDMWCDEAAEIFPEDKQPTKIEIGDKILLEVFEGNPYAQLADMVKAQVITLALLVPVLGKETVKAAYADLLATVQKVSESRVSQGLEPYDLSFLD